MSVQFTTQKPFLNSLSDTVCRIQCIRWQILH